ncbi:hypothetical protein Acsp03_26230 [Actinomadura sp. NBRC 104412]|uniref:DUF5682 family protein n=1 Tax=Actinomadura sp. NBRC 104412 TaxID=3032203 RepID=UPI0024A04D8F|nr:DUF5682 family protein [Actinomadura sp. NBRC 104412]GLZ05157.1 hypothetical protein Acsp03_26230 [Actinomadura sp. NBRC 104412]
MAAVHESPLGAAAPQSPPEGEDGVTYIGVRHHSPACARLVRDTIRRLRPAHVLVEGPADFSGRLDELLLGHDLPIAIFSHYRDERRTHASWSPFCEYSPEWVAIGEGRACGAEVRFIDLPAWHPAFAGRRNRYADADERYAEVIERLCAAFAVDNIDALWDHMFEGDDDNGDLGERLAAYFDLVRGESDAGEDDTAREAYMARWVRAAVADADGRPVVVVTGGFHRAAIRRLVQGGDDKETGWPDVPMPPEGALGGSYLVPYSFKRLDAFTGYQSGMPSPEYYQRLWEGGPEAAAAGLTEVVVARLRKRRQRVSTADLIAARTLTEGLARLRGHRHPSRTDLLDGLVAALVTDDLDQRLPWTSRGPLEPGAHPAVAEMVAALSGDRVGALRPGTPAPPLLHDVNAELERLKLDGWGAVNLKLSDDRGLRRSRVLHRLRVLGIPGFTRESGPATGAEPVLEERWTLEPGEHRLPALIEAGAYGATLRDAAATVLEQRAQDAGTEIGRLAVVLFDAALCGCTDISDRIAGTITPAIAAATELGGLGDVLGTTLGLWRHDRLLGTAGSPLFGTVVESCVTRVLWLVEGMRGGPAPAEPARLRALAATRDALLHASGTLDLDRDAALAVAERVSVCAEAPPDLRGAAFGLGWSLGAAADPVRAVLGAASPRIVGDWLAGLFALARDEVLAAEDASAGPGERSVLAVLDELIGGLSEHDFLIALPALRQAFEFFPPRERETIARRLLERRGVRGSARSLLRTGRDPLVLAEARALEERVDALLAAEGLASSGAEVRKETE